MLVRGFPLLLHAARTRVVASDALRGRLLKAFCRCPGSLRAARRRRFLLFFSVFLPTIYGVSFVDSFSDIDMHISAAAFFIHALPCAAMASELYVSLRLNILLIVHDVLYCQEYCDNCFWDCYVWMSYFVA